MVQSKYNKLKRHHLSIDYIKMDTLLHTPQSMLQNLKIITKKKGNKKPTKQNPTKQKSTTNKKHPNKAK